MRITPLDLAQEPLVLNEVLPAGAIDYAPDVRQVGPLQLNGRAELIVEHRGPKEFVEDLRLRAHFQGRFELLCARCLSTVERDLDGDFDLIFRPAGVDAESGEHAISEDETEIGYYEPSGLLLEDAVREQVLLTLPARTLCQEDCKGLCSHCGADLNQASCDCGTTSADPRWGALAGLELGSAKLQ
jgi:uncharacterized protein